MMSPPMPMFQFRADPSADGASVVLVVGCGTVASTIVLPKEAVTTFVRAIKDAQDKLPRLAIVSPSPIHDAIRGSILPVEVRDDLGRPVNPVIR